MTLMDYTWDAPDTDPSVQVEPTSWGYRVAEMTQKGLRFQIARVLFAGVTFGLMAAGGMVWTLSDASFPGDPAFTRAMLSSALYIVAAALVVNGAFTRHRAQIEMDVKGRVLHFVAVSDQGWRKTRKTVRFEEITRFDLAETSLMNELKSALTRWDYGRLTISVHGRRAVHLIGGDMAELEPLLSRLRGDTGVA